MPNNSIGIEALGGCLELPISELLRHFDDIRSKRIIRFPDMFEFLRVNPDKHTSKQSQNESRSRHHASYSSWTFSAEVVMARRRLTVLLIRTASVTRHLRTHLEALKAVEI
ncbi:hypothetical protein Pyn_20974 [Prunus yedoensis var. nudiflora]|uniref:Uncharacterized protein n=1 Tax=Prunus yedoensis var. nudiflora TaxID=2094558 RepID=A0A314ZRS0_PRUYE|nr:hypothetical protein Pyn_20974 [Prunus yedoensis var. nudiflora]